ncbi:hypothetical protein R5R35_001223 [Gryllus longicercus]|uniref:Integrase catalytic domain-containing protein n=1 Tax=Gryllus longicercus TaxID=2509291 RepID=A0AAN9YZ62_9ORTH
MDVVGLLLLTSQENSCSLKLQDFLSKYLIAAPVPNQTAHEIAHHFVHKFILVFGIPDMLLTNRGSNFVSEVFAEVCQLLRIKHLHTTAYHPQTNGALERSRRTLKEYLRHYVNEDFNDWDRWIPFAATVCNSFPHTASKFEPCELVYGRRY